MPLPSLHPLPNNPTTGQAPLAGLRAGPPPASAAGGGGVSRETLKGLQDVYWSDDEDDPDCLLCAEPLDLSDLNFKPCQCGMQICQFCYNKLLTSDSRCPGCRRPYDAKAVVYKPVDVEEVKRARDKKTRRAKTIKQLTAMGRRHLLGVRVVMKNMVYVTGMKIPGSGDEAISILRSNDYFGQYGKISKLYLSDRSALSSTAVHSLDSAESSATSTGVYIVYVRREDAARAIVALDGIPAPSGPPGQVLRACYGTTRYCDAFLRGQKCDNLSCHALHEWGGDSDCFSKEDYEIALTRPAEYEARQKQAQIAAPSLTTKAEWPKPSSISDAAASSALPNSAAWGKGIPVARPAARTAVPIGTSRPVKPPTSVATALPLKSNVAFPLPTPSPVHTPVIKEKKEKREKAPAMARGKSTDSSMSMTTNSAQTSPKRKPAPLASVTPSVAKAPPPPPGLSVASTSATASSSASASSSTAVPPPPGIPAPSESTPEEVVDETQSAESEAGPSSASPAPQTPARYSDHPPPPLTDDPIFIHSPYEEPRLYPFPTSDPGFAYVLGLDSEEVQRYAAQGAYQPSPFSKTLLGLAELGVLAPELPDLGHVPTISYESFSGAFQPFEPIDGGESSSTPVTKPGSAGRGPIEEEEDWEHEGPRTTSRFGFARPVSRSTSIGRGQSPFAMTSRGDERENGAWAEQLQQQQQPHPHQPPPPPQPVFSRSQVDERLAILQQRQGLMNYPSGGSGVSEGWAGMSEAQSPYAGRNDRYRRERDEFDPGMLNYPQNVSTRLFSPDTPSHNNLDEFSHHPSHSPAPQTHSQHPHSHSHSSNPPPGFMHASPLSHLGHHDPRNLAYAQRPQSPTPLSQSFRRF
ncbi:transcriptional repressor [Papiliotrema laurentii]|uniref:Transcriptional repressor n=1 Tax=Papiliotrema laurentii TaxID=5418 RepID=A0AAD9FRK5_PAPLA|nr:transcriptional repressor [Papiliotrema laurentii]